MQISLTTAVDDTKFELGCAVQDVLDSINMTHELPIHHIARHLDRMAEEAEELLRLIRNEAESYRPFAEFKVAPAGTP